MVYVALTRVRDGNEEYFAGRDISSVLKAMGGCYDKPREVSREEVESHVSAPGTIDRRLREFVRGQAECSFLGVSENVH